MLSSGQISLSTCWVKFHPKGDNCWQNNGQEINGWWSTKIQTLSYAVDYRDWPGKQWLAEHQPCRCTHLQCFLLTVKPFWRVISSTFYFWMNPFFFQIVHYYVNKTESLLTCHTPQNCCFVANFVDKALVDDSTSHRCIWGTAISSHCQMSLGKVKGHLMSSVHIYMKHFLRHYNFTTTPAATKLGS